MAQATGYLCDRCGARVEDDDVLRISVPEVAEWGGILDLCIPCQGQLKRFLDNDDVGRGKTTFEEFAPARRSTGCCVSDCQGTCLKRVFN